MLSGRVLFCFPETGIKKKQVRGLGLRKRGDCIRVFFIGSAEKEVLQCTRT